MSGQKSLLDSFLENKSRRTKKAYRQDLNHLASFLDLPSVEGATMVLIAKGEEGATDLINKYRDFLEQKGLRSSTINRRLCTIRAFLQYARQMERIDWELKVLAVPKQSINNGNVKIPAVKRLIASLDRTTSKGYRDFAILRLIFDLALRRSELVALNYPDNVDLEEGCLRFTRSQCTEPVIMPLSEETREALDEWIKIRGAGPGPLFINYDPARKGDRLTGRSVDRNVVKPLAIMIGLHISPHQLRNMAIEQALQLAREEKVALDDVLNSVRKHNLSSSLVMENRSQSSANQ